MARQGEDEATLAWRLWARHGRNGRATQARPGSVRIASNGEARQAEMGLQDESWHDEARQAEIGH